MIMVSVTGYETITVWQLGEGFQEKKISFLTSSILKEHLYSIIQAIKVFLCMQTSPNRIIKP